MAVYLGDLDSTIFCVERIFQCTGWNMKYSTDIGELRFKRKILAQSLALALGTTLLGSALPALAAAPQVSSYSPADDSAGNGVGTNLTLGFDQTISAVAGKNLVIKKSADSSVVETIDAGDTAKVTLSGSKATINPSADLEYGTGYYVEVAPGAFVNAGGDAYAGIADTTSWNFNTVAASILDVTAFSPANGSTGVASAANLSMSFRQCVTAVPDKNIVIRTVSRDAEVETIAATDNTRVSLSCSGGKGTVTINPANDLLFDTAYYVQVDSGAFTGNISGVSFAGILDNAIWAFTTIADTTAPTVPEGLAATAAGATQISLVWTASADTGGATLYKVYRNDFLVASLGAVTNYRDSGLTASTTYSYSVQACDAAGNCSSRSTPASATTAAGSALTDTQAPTVPTELAAAVTGSSAIYLSWKASTDDVGVARYEVYRGGTALAASGIATSFTDTGLTASTAYDYSVAACDRAGNCSAQSPTVSVTTNSPPTRIASTTELLEGTNLNASVGADGSLVIAAAPGQPPQTVALKTDAPVNVEIKLPTGRPVIFSSNGTTQQITDVSGRSQFLTTRQGGITQIELVKGQIQVDADKSGTAVPVTSSSSQSTGALVTSEDKTSVAVVKDETSARVFIDTGKAGYAAGSSPSVTLYQGENGAVDPGGKLTEVVLGSNNGEKQVPGDPLAVTIPKDADTKLPNLEGTLARLENTVTLLDIVGDAIKELAGDTSGQLNYDKTTGVVTYVLGQTTYRLSALGDVRIQLDQFAASSLTATAGGALSLASRGIQMSLAGALSYFSDLQSQVLALDANGKLSLKSTGAVEARMFGGRFVVMPGTTASLPGNPTTLPGFETDASGYAVFRDRLGTLQTLYPTFLDSNSLNVTFAPLDPSLSLTNNGDGTVTAVLPGLGLTVTLLPEYTVIAQPPGHDSDPYWEDKGVFFFHNSDQSAQGFRLR